MVSHGNKKQKEGHSMKESYTLNELAMITGLTTRTLRNHLRLGTLKGEKPDGAWMFTPEDIEAFFAVPAARESMEARRNAVVFDFLADRFKRANRACVILDFAVDDGESEAISRFFCESVSDGIADIELRVSRDRGLTRVILSGGEEQVSDILGRYYSRPRS